MVERPVTRYEQSCRENPRNKPMIPDKTRGEVLKRATAGGKRPRCEITGVYIDILTDQYKGYYSHKNHDATLSTYNSLDNIQYVSGLGHLKHHKRYIDNPSEIGLTADQNFYAIEKIWESLTEHERFQAEDMGMFLHEMLPRPEGETEFQKFCRENSAAEDDRNRTKVLATSLTSISKAKHEQISVVSYAARGIPIPGLPITNESSEIIGVDTQWEQLPINI